MEPIGVALVGLVPPLLQYESGLPPQALLADYRKIRLTVCGVSHECKATFVRVCSAAADKLFSRQAYKVVIWAAAARRALQIMQEDAGTPGREVVILPWQLTTLRAWAYPSVLSTLRNGGFQVPRVRRCGFTSLLQLMHATVPELAPAAGVQVIWVAETWKQATALTQTQGCVALSVSELVAGMAGRHHHNLTAYLDAIWLVDVDLTIQVGIAGAPTANGALAATQFEPEVFLSTLAEHALVIYPHLVKPLDHPRGGANAPNPTLVAEFEIEFELHRPH